MLVGLREIRRLYRARGGGTRYVMIVRDDFVRYSWVYLTVRRSDATTTVKNFFGATRTDGLPRIVRSNDDRW